MMARGDGLDSAKSQEGYRPGLRPGVQNFLTALKITQESELLLIARVVRRLLQALFSQAQPRINSRIQTLAVGREPSGSLTPDGLRAGDLVTRSRRFAKEGINFGTVPKARFSPPCLRASMMLYCD